MNGEGDDISHQRSGWKEKVEYASFDEDLWILLVNPTMRQRLRDFIIEKKLSS